MPSPLSCAAGFPCLPHARKTGAGTGPAPVASCFPPGKAAARPPYSETKLSGNCLFALSTSELVSP